MNAQEEILELPDFERPAELIASERIEVSVAMREFEPLVRFYLMHYDSPEARFKAKNSEEFVL
jgi:hypothetical protein